MKSPKPSDPPPKTGVMLMGLTAGACRWPVSGEGAATIFCGGKQWREGKPYCRYHSTQAYGEGAVFKAEAVEHQAATGA